MEETTLIVIAVMCSVLGGAFAGVGFAKSLSPKKTQTLDSNLDDLIAVKLHQVYGLNVIDAGCYWEIYDGRQPNGTAIPKGHLQWYCFGYEGGKLSRG